MCTKEFTLDISCEDEYVRCGSCGEQLRSPSVASLRPGSIVGDYVIQKRIGVGGMGEVYLSEQRSMMRSVALKVLNSDLYNDKTYLERFYREVRTLAQIEHPNVVKAIETGCDNDICYFSMMYIAGEDMKERLDSTGKIPEMDALHVALNVADALRYVWEKHKIIHRDIKPANIILTDDGEVKLMDLGISKVVEKEEKSPGLTLAGMMVGSPYYVSPEQAKAEKDIDFRADMYSLGASLYHMLTGQVPFDDESSMAIIADHLSTMPPDPRSIAPEVSEKSARIISIMMRKKKDDRYPSWNELIEKVEDAISSLSSQGKTTTMLTIPKKLTSATGEKTSGKISRKISRKISKKTSRKTSGRTRRRSPSSISKKHSAHTDPMKGVQRFLMDKCFGNLYVRFVFLVVLLFFTLLAFTNLVRKSVEESRRNAIAAKYATALTEIKNIKDSGRWSRDKIRAIRSTLIQLGRNSDPKYAELAKKQLNYLKHLLLDIQKKKKAQMLKTTLETLKKESSELEETGRLEEAIEVWREYKSNGPFAIDLRDDIDEHVTILKKKLSKTPRKKGGIR
ncbi:MAG: serine/threonine protein kinase [Victivallales bacterium]|nr:serine/threonine protein kinase [Victivallales bacterium]